jgi:hypothetical protein
MVVEGVVPRDGTGRLMVPFRPGDVLRLSTAFVETVVTKATASEVTLRWPWLRNDPKSRYDWSSAEFTFPVEGPQHPLYRTEPPLRQLRAGQRCRIGIPPALVHVLCIKVLDTPEDTGMLPRPSGWLMTLPAGMSFDPADPVELPVGLIAASEPDGPTLGVEMAEPTRMELVFRPYAFLADGDVVTDPGGRRWRFRAPFWWQELDGCTGHPGPVAHGTVAPDWPLALAAEHGAPDRARSGEVAVATAGGSHEREVARWRELAGAEPVTIIPFV